MLVALHPAEVVGKDLEGGQPILVEMCTDTAKEESRNVVHPSDVLSDLSPDCRHVRVSLGWESNPSDFHVLWLRATCQSEHCLDKSQQRLFLPHHVGDVKNLRAEKSWVEQSHSSDGPKRADTVHACDRSPEGTLFVRMSDGHTTEHPLSYLRAYDHKVLPPSAFFEYDRKALCLPLRHEELKKISWDELFAADTDAGEAAVWRWQTALLGNGLAIITDMPNQDLAVADLAERIAPVWVTIYGKTFVVEAKQNPENIAYSSKGLALHTDLCAYESVPFIQLLHCREFDETISGGESTFTDVFAAAGRLQEKHPEKFEDLTRIYATFHKCRHDQHMVYRRPHLVLDDTGELVGVNWSPPFEGPGPLGASTEDLERYYEAYQAFGREIEDPDHILRFRQQPGECITFLNKHVLHARDEFFAQGDSKRLLEGCYIGTDDFLNKMRMLSRKFKPGKFYYPGL